MLLLQSDTLLKEILIQYRNKSKVNYYDCIQITCFDHVPTIHSKGRSITGATAAHELLMFVVVFQQNFCYATRESKSLKICLADLCCISVL